MPFVFLERCGGHFGAAVRPACSQRNLRSVLHASNTRERRTTKIDRGSSIIGILGKRDKRANRIEGVRALSEREGREVQSNHHNHEDDHPADAFGRFVEPVSEAEAAANERRRLEALELRASQANGSTVGAQDEEEEDADPFVGLNDWRWTLNWDEITNNMVVGACPRVPKDVNTIKDRTGCTAILCLQSHSCFEALGIDHPLIRQRGADIGVKVLHIPIRDFDHASQAEMIPEAVRVLNLLLKTGHKCYVHCTAGINRATLTVLSYLTFVEGFSLDEAHALVKSKRPQAHPYLDCWKTARKRLLEGRSEEVSARSQLIYEARCYSCEAGTTGDDWYRAERDLIREMYQNKWDCDKAVVQSWNATNSFDLKQIEGFLQNERQKCQILASKVQSTAFLQSELDATRMEVNTLKEELISVSQKLKVLQDKEKELEALKSALKAEKDQVQTLNKEIHPLRKNLDEAWTELQRKEKLEVEMKNANEQMKAMRSAFEVLHTNLNRSCDILQRHSDEKEKKVVVVEEGEEEEEEQEEKEKGILRKKQEMDSSIESHPIASSVIDQTQTLHLAREESGRKIQTHSNGNTNGNGNGASYSTRITE